MNKEERIQELIADTAGDSVTVDRVQQAVDPQAISTLFEDGERLHHVLGGKVLDMYDRSHGSVVEDSQTRKIPSSGQDLFTLVTDRRIVIVVQRPDDPDQVPIALKDVQSIDHESALGTNTRLRVRTADREYLIDTSGSETEHSKAATAFVTDWESDPETADDPDDDVFGKIEKLAELNEGGALTDEEFADKKAELLDRL